MIMIRILVVIKSGVGAGPGIKESRAVRGFFVL
jgi:hypothetical protein